MVDCFPVRIDKIDRIVVAEGVGREVVVFLRQRVRSGPAAEERVVLTGSVVDVRSSETELLLLAVVAEPVAVILEACSYIPSASERIVVVGLDHFSLNTVNNSSDASKVVVDMEHRNHAADSR